MARSNDQELGATVFKELAPRYGRDIKAAGTIRQRRLVTLGSGGTVTEATVDDRSVVGALSADAVRLVSGDSVEYGQGIAWGPCTLEADLPVISGQRLKAGVSGLAMPFVDSTLSGATIKTTGVGLAFTNQPANDGVEIVSANAGDTTQTTTIIGTTTGTDTVVVETVALNGTTVVSTVKTDWGVILAVKLSASCAGTVTWREASGNATITTATTGVLSKGVETVAAGTARQAYNVAPTAVADGASTKQIGIQGTNSAGTVIYSSKALNGTTAVTFGAAFRTVTEVYTGDIENTVTATVKVGAENDELLAIGKALESAAAGIAFNAFVLPL